MSCSLDAHVGHRLESCLLQAHPHVDVIDGKQLDGLGHFVYDRCCVTGQQESTATAVRGVGLRLLHLNRNVVLVVQYSNGPNVLDQVSSEEVLAAVVVQTLEELYHVVGVGKDVVIAV